MRRRINAFECVNVEGLPSCIAETSCMTGRPRDISDADLERMRELRSQGKTLNYIVETMGYCKTTINRYTRGLGKSNKRHILSDETLATMRAMREGGALYREIAEALSLPMFLVALNCTGVKLKAPLRRKQHSCNDLTPDQIEQVRALRAEGVPFDALARRFGTTEHFIRKYSDDLGTKSKGRFQRASGKVAEVGCRVCNYTIAISTDEGSFGGGAMFDAWLLRQRVVCEHCHTSFALLSLASESEWFFLFGISPLQD